MQRKIEHFNDLSQCPALLLVGKLNCGKDGHIEGEKSAQVEEIDEISHIEGKGSAF